MASATIVGAMDFTVAITHRIAVVGDVHGEHRHAHRRTSSSPKESLVAQGAGIDLTASTPPPSHTLTQLSQPLEVAVGQPPYPEGDLELPGRLRQGSWATHLLAHGGHKAGRTGLLGRRELDAGSGEWVSNHPWLPHQVAPTAAPTHHTRQTKPQWLYLHPPDSHCSNRLRSHWRLERTPQELLPAAAFHGGLLRSTASAQQAPVVDSTTLCSPS
ncbi:hypothetical protein NDU88_001548 [Pleurodeles waltl]|uniref:Uncharacterized protein n=1 Tax=Pleurodeles waltl TaxID=8319 RepID=A0AAV7MQ74_PLEWA|nr:hypothetical protein NDU88_001548 [Pleurodeles waltl]